MSPTTPQPQKSLRWWPAILILVLAAGFLGHTWLSESNDTQMQVMKTMTVSFVATLLLLLWLFLLSRLSGRARLRWLAALLLLGIGFFALVEVRGMSGNLVPILGWRWKGEPTLEPGLGRAPVTTSSEDFPQFLGPHRDGRLPDIRLASDWKEQPPKEIWRREVGAGWSAFAVAGNAAVTQEQRDDKELVVRYTLDTGELVWAHSDPVRYESVIGGIGPRATPTIDGGRVYTLGATGLLNCLDLETGERRWGRDVVTEHQAAQPDWGKSSSPLVVGDLVVVSAGGPAGHSLAAYHKDTGEPAWHGGSDGSGYSSPFLAELAGVPQIVIFNQASVAGHDPADGRLLWSHSWSRQQPNVAQPLVLGEDRLLVSSGYGIGSKLFRVHRDEAGDFVVATLWESPRLKAKFTNPVLDRGHVYGLDDGVLVCLDPETGERCWKKGRYGHGQTLLIGGLLLVQAENGEVALVEANPEEYRELASFKALRGKTWNPPAFAGGKYLLVRNDSEAACYELPLAP